MTTKQRHKIYKRVLVYFLENPGPVYSICLTINRILETTIRPNRFTEVFLFRPTHDSDGFWWPYYDKDSRITCLLFCIEMTKP